MRYQTYATPRADLAEAVREFDSAPGLFVADQVLPDRPVPLEAGTVSVAQREGALKRTDTKHANGAAFNRATGAMEDLAYACIDYGLEDVLTDRDREKYADDFDGELELVETLVHKMRMEREHRVKTAVFNTTTWTGAAYYTDNKATPWSTTTTNIFTQVKAAKEYVAINSGFEANSMIIGGESLANMLMNAGIIARFPGANVVTEEMIRSNLAALFGLENLIVGKAIYDTTPEGIAYSGSRIWAKTYAMVCRINPRSLRLGGGLGRTFRWDKMDASEDVANSVLQYREEQTDGDVYRVRKYLDEKIIDVNAGHLMRIET